MVLNTLIGTVLGFLSGLGVGGGSLLILWLTLIAGIDQSAARTINLLFFLPSAVISAVFRWKQGTLPIRKVLPAIVSGVLSAALLSQWEPQLNATILKKGFGLLLLASGLRELLMQPKQ